MAVENPQQVIAPEAAPTSGQSNTTAKTNGSFNVPKTVAWYQAELSHVPDTALQVFRKYSHMQDDEIIDHIYRVRDQAWTVMPWPCVGLFRFLDFPASMSPVYPTVLERICNGATFLDLGCCFGQDIRKLVVDGAPDTNLIGADLESRFMELGYDLFQDRDSLKARFIAGNALAEDFLPEYHDSIDIIFLGSFLHCFTIEQQRVIVQQLCKLLKKTTGSMVFGRHMAMEKGGYKTNATGVSVFHHSPQTIRELWDTAPEGEWKVDSQLVPYASESWDNGVKYQDKADDECEVKQMYFSALRM